MPLDPPDIYAFTSPAPYLEAWLVRQPSRSANAAADWLAKHAGCSRQHIWSLAGGSRKVQPEHVPALARALGLDDEGREYLRRLVALQNASVRDARELRLSVWEIHAAHAGISAVELENLRSRESVPGAASCALLPLITLLETLGCDLRIRELERMLLASPGPGPVGDALARHGAGESVEASLYPRLLAIRGPADLDGADELTWHGLLDQGREHLLRVPAQERDFDAFTWSADAQATLEAGRALKRYDQGLRALTRDTAGQPVERLLLVCAQQVPLTDVLHVTRKRPGVETDSEPLPASAGSSRIEERSGDLPSQAEGRPCIYAFQSFASFARAWIAWRKGAGQQTSARFLERHFGLSRSVLNDLMRGASRLRDEQVPILAKGLDLDPQEAAYLEGLARHERAEDLDERVRTRHALLSFAARHGVRTLEGESFLVASHWGARAIHALSFLPGFRASPAWISLVLRGRLPWQDAARLFEAMRAVGMAPGGVGRILEAPEHRGLASYAYQRSLLRLLQGEVQIPTREQVLRAWVLALPEAALPRLIALQAAYKAEIRRCLEAGDARASSGESSPDRVLLIAGQLFPLTHVLRARIVRREPRT